MCFSVMCILLVYFTVNVYSCDGFVLEKYLKAVFTKRKQIASIFEVKIENNFSPFSFSEVDIISSLCNVYLYIFPPLYALLSCVYIWITGAV